MVVDLPLLLIGQDVVQEAVVIVAELAVVAVFIELIDLSQLSACEAARLRRRCVPLSNRNSPTPRWAGCFYCFIDLVLF